MVAWGGQAPGHAREASAWLLLAAAMAAPGVAANVTTLASQQAARRAAVSNILWLYNLQGRDEWNYCFDQPFESPQCSTFTTTHYSQTITTLTATSTTQTRCTKYADCWVICADLVQMEPSVCRDEFCPTCPQAHKCDTTCNVCSKDTTTTATTVTLTTTSCVKVNLLDDKLCTKTCESSDTQCSVSLCDLLFCPDCDSTVSGMCDKTCGYCTTETQTSSSVTGTTHTTTVTTITGTGTTTTETRTTVTNTRTITTTTLSSATSTSKATLTSTTGTTITRTTCRTLDDCLESCPQLVASDRNICFTNFCPTCPAAHVCDKSCSQETGDPEFCSSDPPSATATTATAVTAVTATATSTSTTNPEECEDYVPPGEPEWHDPDGMDFTCSWYASSPSACDMWGDIYMNFGHTASEACCACGGGDVEDKTTTSCVSVNVWSDDICEKAAGPMSCCDACPDIFCPSCNSYAAGKCDALCGFCTTSTTGSPVDTTTRTTSTRTTVTLTTTTQLGATATTTTTSATATTTTLTSATVTATTTTPPPMVTTTTCHKLDDCLTEHLCRETANSCETHYCPTCPGCHLCDTTCGFCTDPTTPTVTTVTTTRTTTTQTTTTQQSVVSVTHTTCVQVDEVPPHFLGSFADSTQWCEGQCGPKNTGVSDACGVCKSLFCPSCDLAGWCDKTCGYCTQRRTSTSTVTSVPDVCVPCKVRATIPIAGCDEPLPCGSHRKCVAYHAGSFAQCMNPLVLEFTCSGEPLLSLTQPETWPLGSSWSSQSVLLYANTTSDQAIDPSDGLRFAQLKGVKGSYDVRCQACGIGDLTEDLSTECGLFQIRLFFGPNVVDKMVVDESMLKGYQVSLVRACDNLGLPPTSMTKLAFVEKDPTGQVPSTEVLQGPGVTTDIFVVSGLPDTRYEGDHLEVQNAGVGSVKWALVKFEIPSAVTGVVVSAYLEVDVFDSGNDVLLHEMLVDWDSSSTFRSVGMTGTGIGNTGVWSPGVVAELRGVDMQVIDVTSSVQRWQSGQSPNNGWIFEPTGSDGTDFYSSTGKRPPVLRITYRASDSSPMTLEECTCNSRNTYDVTVDGSLPDDGGSYRLMVSPVMADGEVVPIGVTSEVVVDKCVRAVTNYNSDATVPSLATPLPTSPADPALEQSSHFIVVSVSVAVIFLSCLGGMCVGCSRKQVQMPPAKCVEEHPFSVMPMAGSPGTAALVDFRDWPSATPPDGSSHHGAPASPRGAQDDIALKVLIDSAVDAEQVDAWLEDKEEAEAPPAGAGLEAASAPLRSMDGEGQDDEAPLAEPDSEDAGPPEPLLGGEGQEPRSFAIFRRSALFDKSVERLEIDVEWRRGAQPLVTSVRPGGEADSRGLAAGDQLVEIDGQRTYGRHRRDLLPLLQRRPLVISFDRKEQVLDPDEPHVELTVALPEQSCDGVGAGLTLAREGRRLAVNEVKEGSPAWQAGVLKGDVITRVSGASAKALDEGAVAALLAAERPALLTVRRPPQGPVLQELNGIQEVSAQ